MPFFRRGDDDFGRALSSVVQGAFEKGAVATYVLSGQDPGVLQRLGGSPYGIDVFLHHGASRDERSAGQRVLAGFADQPVEVMHRWCRVLEAAFAGHGHRWGQGMPPVGGLEWPELVLRHAVQVVRGTDQLPFALADLGRVLARDGASSADLLAASLELSGTAGYQDDGGRPALARLPGFDGLLLEHRAQVAAAATVGAPGRRVAVLGLLDALDPAGLPAFTDVVVRAATANAREVRARGEVLFRRLAMHDRGSATSALRGVATDGKPDERARALQLLRDRARDDADRAWAEETAADDRAASVRALVDAWRAAEETVPAAHEPEPPALPPVDWTVPRDVADRVARTVVDDLIRRTRQANEAGARLAAVHPTHRHRETAVPHRRSATALAEALSATQPVRAPVPPFGSSPFPGSRSAVVEQATSLEPAAAVQLLRACGFLDDHPRWVWPEVLEHHHRVHGRPDLLAIQQLLDGVGIDGFRQVWGAWASTYGPLGRDWPAEDVWPFVARNLDAVLAYGHVRPDDWHFDSAGFFAAMATFPRLPARALERLYDIALGTQRSVRGLAQDALTRDPGRVPRVTAALGDGRGEVRSVAARWLARTPDREALPALQAAWAKQKQDVVRGDLLDALEALGEPVADYLDLAATTAAAEKFVARGLPAALGWLAWEAVPDVTWADSGDPVPRAVVQWLVGTAVKARSPEPNAVLRRYAELVTPGDRERLGRHLLEAWTAEDLRPVPIAEAEQRALQEAMVYHHWYAADPSSPYHGKTVAEVAAMLLPRFARQPVGSAIASKGLLAVVAATGGRDVVPPVERYLKEWYGQRAAQGKALIAMLAWVEHPAATQLVLSVGSRFRTKSFQQEATRQAEALAERKGWTLAELADRTIPTAGFATGPEGAVLELSYGDRVFSARLLPDLNVSLTGPDGRQLATLPSPRQSDDAELATAARKALTAAKKDVKAIAKQQAERLYEALCTERSWPVDDWRRYLVDHPVVGPAVRRLVWVAVEPDRPGEPVASFRPLDDGTLTDVDDDEVDLAPHLLVRLAHDSLLPDADVRRWVEHLADYEVDPLFQQLGKGTYELPDDRRQQTEVADLEGHLLEAFALRGRALKLGWTRGPSEDAAWFYSYRKRFPTLGLVAELGFTGNVLPEENRAVALTRLSFHRELQADRTAPVPLAEVPSVLLSETVGDLRLLAAEGTGFDADWERKTQY